MTDSQTSDPELLRAYVDRRDEAAFARLVERYFPVVYAAARRQVGGDAHTAEDVTQAVFIMLARKAASLRPNSVLVGWLIKAARLAGKAAMRAEIRRKRREKRAADMNPRHDQIATPADDPANPGGPLPRIDAQLDEALERLNDRDRAAVTLRYLHDRSIAEVAQILHTTPTAAEKRVQRAVAKLRGILIRRGVAVTPAVLTGVMRQQLLAAPAPALTPATAAANAIHIAHASPAAVAIANKAMLAMSFKGAVAVVAAIVLLAVGAGIVFYTYRALDRGMQTRTARVQYETSRRPAPRSVWSRVGVFLSLSTAREAETPTHLRNFNSQTTILSELRADDLELVPLVEHGSQTDEVQVKTLAALFPGKQPIDIADLAAVNVDAQPDVIVVCRACYPAEEALPALEAVVRGGTGIVVRQCLGGDRDGYKRESVRNLRLFVECEPDAILPIDGTKSEATIVNAHPLLGDLSTHVGQTIQMGSYGAYGVLEKDATPLIRLTSLEHHKFFVEGPVRPKDGYAAYPLAVGQLGKGRVVSASIDAGAMPAELDQATKGRFTIRAVRWAAGRNIN